MTKDPFEIVFPANCESSCTFRRSAAPFTTRRMVSRMTASRIGMSSSQALIGIAESRWCKRSEDVVLVCFRIKERTSAETFSFHSGLCARNNKSQQARAQVSKKIDILQKSLLQLIPVLTTPAKITPVMNCERKCSFSRII